MSRATLEKLVFLVAAIVVGLGGWFWTLQVLGVIELLEMAYG